MNSNVVDWGEYVKAMTALHGLELGPAREAEVVEQMQRIYLLAQRFFDFPLDVHIEAAPVFRP